MNIYIGNLAYEVSDDELRQEFEPFGDIESCNIIKDKYSGRSRGFGFIEMPNKNEAMAAISEMNGKEVKGKAINVNEARPRSDDRRGGGGGGRNRGGGRY